MSFPVTCVVLAAGSRIRCPDSITFWRWSRSAYGRRNWAGEHDGWCPRVLLG